MRSDHNGKRLNTSPQRYLPKVPYVFAVGLFTGVTFVLKIFCQE
jgi:hypothetical protein